MFDQDKWQEIFSTIKQNKLRTFLTGFSIAWGIFMLVVLLGAGRGLQNAAEHAFTQRAKNSFKIYSGRTSKEYKGYKVGRDIQFTNETHDWLDKKLEGIQHLTSIKYLGGEVKYEKKSYNDFRIRGVYPDYAAIEKRIVTEGRFLNTIDINETRKAAVIGEKVKEQLFEDESPIGHNIFINDIAFQVVGVFDSEIDSNKETIYIPTSTSQRLYEGNEDVGSLQFTIDTEDVKVATAKEEETRQLLSRLHQFNPKDNNAIFIINNLEGYEETLIVFMFLNGFIWFIAIGSIIAGIVGISNIMVIIVKDRTKEIGVRKALGAAPFSIISLILSESIFITSITGAFGLILGSGLLALINYLVPPSEMFRHPSVDLSIAISALIVLVVSGAIAGFFPARKAASIKPIESLRKE